MEHVANFREPGRQISYIRSTRPSDINNLPLRCCQGVGAPDLELCGAFRVFDLSGLYHDIISNLKHVSKCTIFSIEWRPTLYRTPSIITER